MSMPVLRIGSRRRSSWIVLGVLLTVGGALAALLTISAAGTRRTVLVAAHDLRPGAPIQLQDLRTVTIAEDVGIEVLPATSARDLVGRVPVAPLAEGTLLADGLLAGSSSLTNGESLVSASFKAGSVPISDLAPGSRVAAIAVGDKGSTTDTAHDVLAIGTTHNIDIAKNGDVAVSLRVPLDRGAAVADAAARDRLRLILVPDDASAEMLAAQAPKEGG